MKFKLILVLVTCKNEEDPSKNEEWSQWLKSGHNISTIISLRGFSNVQGQLTP